MNASLVSAGLVAPPSDCYDSFGNLLPPTQRLPFLFIGGALAVTLITETSFYPLVAGVALTGVAPTISIS